MRKGDWKKLRYQEEVGEEVKSFTVIKESTTDRRMGFKEKEDCVRRIEESRNGRAVGEKLN